MRVRYGYWHTPFIVLSLWPTCLHKMQPSILRVEVFKYGFICCRMNINNTYREWGNFRICKKEWLNHIEKYCIILYYYKDSFTFMKSARIVHMDIFRTKRKCSKRNMESHSWSYQLHVIKFDNWLQKTICKLFWLNYFLFNHLHIVSFL